MKAINFLMGCAATCLLAGCADEWAVNDPSQQNEGTPLTIRATNGSDADTRLTFGDDGLTLLWENGDQLVLVDVNDKIAPIYLTTELDKPSRTAVFRSESGVPAGTYYIRNYHGTKYDKFEDWMTIDLKKNSSDNYSPNYNRDYQLNILNQSGRPAELYEGPITIADGQTHIDVELKHMLAMLKFNITNAPADPSYSFDIQMGMVCPETPFPTKVRIDNSAEPQYAIPHMRLSNKRINSMTDVPKYGAFILPVNLTGKDVYFYVTIIDYTTQTETVYEIKKAGKELKAGTSYTINLDLNTAKEISVTEGKISTAEQLRALAYTGMGRGSGSTYTITQNIDCKDEVLFPIAMNNYKIIEGQNHTLENITINWPYDYAGLFSYSHAEIKDLTLKNCTIEGKNYVGALLATGNQLNVTNCHLSGSNSIKGNEYVGGLIGENRIADPNSCTVSKETIVEGVNIVGGIAGVAGEITDCLSAATVKGNSSVGGIVGQARQNITACSSIAIVEATGNYAGGIAGGLSDYIDMSECSFTDGTVSGGDYVGGIIGGSGGRNLTAAIELCYSTGTVKGNAYVGGIAGSDCYINNCYSLGKIEGTNKATTAGISGGNAKETTPQNCYFAGTLTNGGYGITGKGTVTNCLTTAATLSNADTEDDNKYKNLTSIVDMVTHINGEEAYSTSTIWEDFNYKCPKFQWQLSGVEFGDENGEVETPPFIKGEEW